MLIDTHAHLIYDSVKTEEIIKNMKSDCLEKIITIGTEVSDSVKSVDLANKEENIYCMVGIHPEVASQTTNKDLEIIDELATNNKVVGIGEIGLDYHYTQDNIEQQKKIFIKQLNIAKKHNLPVCIHSRDAKEDTYEILKENKDCLVNGGVMHCYCYDSEYALKFIELGLYISFAGNYTYKKYDREIVKNIPLNRILIETDSPFLTPVPYRGEKNEPKFVRHTAQKIADELEMDYNEFVNNATENTYRLFKKLKG